MTQNILTLSLALFLCLTIKETHQAFGYGKCAQAPVIRDFNSTLYSGVWYEITKFPVIYELGLSCVKAEYGALNSSFITVRNSGINKVFKSNVVTDGFATVANLSEPNFLKVTFPQSFFSKMFQFSGPYKVWATDYVTYSVVYSCTEQNIFGFTFKTETLWILARARTLDSKIVDAIKAQASAAKIDISYLQATDQNC